MDTMLARQPIFDPAERVIGYQIFYPDPEGGATPDSVLHAVLESGVGRITGGEVAFVNVAPETLLTGVVELMDPGGVVLVLDGRVRDAAVVERCRAYHERGYHLAVDAHPAMDPASPLLDIAEMARVHVRDAESEPLRGLTERARSRHIHLLAEGVENATQRDRCRALGFRLFQGVLFNRPEVVERRDPAVEHLQVFRLLKDIRNPVVSDAQIEETFRHDPALTYRFLSMVNSAAMGGHRVESIGYAIRLMGRESLSRWLSLLLLSPFAGKGVSAEVAATAVVRARFCELLAESTGRPWAAESLFTVGLFSRLDLLLGTPLEHIVDQVAFPDPLRSALLSRGGPDGEALALVEAYEAGRWDEVKSRSAALDLSAADLARLHYMALPWASGADEEAILAAADQTPAHDPRVAADRGRLARLRRWIGAHLSRRVAA